MEHKTLEQLEALASLHAEMPDRMTRLDRLDRWASVLEREPRRRLRMLVGTEYQAPGLRDRLQCSGSPLAVAFEDPVLRAAGLRGDSYGAAREFFELSHRELHRIVCYCHNGLAAEAQTVAARVRALARRHAHAGVVARACSFITGR